MNMDSRTWKPLYDKVKDLDMEMMVLGCRIQDSGNCQRIVKKTGYSLCSRIKGP